MNRTLTFSFSRTTVAVRAALEVRLTSVETYYVAGNKLVVMGEAGRTQEVVIFDLLKAKEADSFFCYYPQRISDGWIAYVEYYPSNGAGNPRDVVLVYDLYKTATQNRLEIAKPNRQQNMIRVGIPIYPESNALQHSYENFTEGRSSATTVLPHTFLLTRSKKLLFVATDGTDARDYHDYLVVVDASRGLRSLAFRHVEIPKDQLKRVGENPNYIEVDSLEAVSPDSVRLHVSGANYGVSSILMKVP